jgi:hypothetical protein
MTTYATPVNQPEPVEDDVVSMKQRLSGIVQIVHQRPQDIAKRRWESALVFFVTTGAYTWFGYWLVVQMHVVGFEPLDRLNRALMIWHNDPAKLSALGFDYPPLATLLISPLAIFPKVASSLAVVPVASAIFAGLMMMSLNTLARRCLIPAPLRYPALIAFALNPLVALYASTGARQFVWIAFVVMAMGAIVAWYVTADVRFVMLSGLAYSVAALSGYTSILWFLLTAFMIGAILARLGARGPEVEGTAVGFSAPTVYVIALWTVFNLILLSKPFEWITAARDAGGSGPGNFSGVELLQDTWWLVLYAAPIAIVALPALIFFGAARNNPLAMWLGLLLAAAIVAPAGSVLLGLSDSPMQMRNALPILVFAVIGGLWLARSADGSNVIVSAILIVLLLLSIPWTFHWMKDYRYQNLEAPFAAAISTRQSQEGTTTITGATVGVADEQAMAAYIDDNITADNSILTDNSQTYAVMLLTGQPRLFFDRVDKSDGPWLAAAHNPANVVDYLLVSTDSSQDLLSQEYPDAINGTNPGLPVVFRTDRYVLLGVTPTFDPTASTESFGTQSTDNGTDTTTDTTSNGVAQ